MSVGHRGIVVHEYVQQLLSSPSTKGASIEMCPLKPSVSLSLSQQLYPVLFAKPSAEGVVRFLFKFLEALLILLSEPTWFSGSLTIAIARPVLEGWIDESTTPRS